MNLAITPNLTATKPQKNARFGIAVKGEPLHVQELAQNIKVELFPLASEQLNLAANMSKTQFQELITLFANIRITPKTYIEIISAHNVFQKAKQTSQSAIKLTRDNIPEIAQRIRKSDEANYKL